jgi:hypothetical protein
MPEPDDRDPADLIAAMRAEGDQMQTAGRELASILVTFHRTLSEGGVSQQAADAITSSYWGLLIAKGLLNG